MTQEQRMRIERICAAEQLRELADRTDVPAENEEDFQRPDRFYELACRIHARAFKNSLTVN